jgi:hypothetical protein
LAARLVKAIEAVAVVEKIADLENEEIRFHSFVQKPVARSGTRHACAKRAMFHIFDLRLRGKLRFVRSLVSALLT